jgi:hypothetical protein
MNFEIDEVVKQKIMDFEFGRSTSQNIFVIDNRSKQNETCLKRQSGEPLQRLSSQI